ncbi:MAG TPA: tRNA lysidine(34) synthetase TilS [Steroidobacteraceae bacterium]|nr:tRNA lysidine(34) synthetase TilS [Steroidobacteraceae bacterium]
MSFSAASLYAGLASSVPEGAAGLVMALSGGADSAALLAGLAALGGGFRGLPLRAVHIDHGLQAAASEFREACKNLCEHLGVPLELIRVEVQSEAGLSIEAAARAARYAALAAQLQPRECLLTAHHRQDQAETLLLQALRGAGVKGLSAMPVCRILGLGWHARPVLDVPHGELLKLGRQLENFKVIDPMNGDLRFDRTYLRKAIWPLIETRWPGAEIALSRSARHMAEAQELLHRAAAADVARLRDGDALSVPGLRALPQANRMNAVRAWLDDAGVEAPSTARLAEALRQVFDADADHQPAIVWGNKALRRYRQRLFLTEAECPRLEGARPWATGLGSSIALGASLGNLTWSAQMGGVAADALPAVVMVRRREGGETLKPARSAKTQTVQHLCQSQGVLPWMRDALPLVFAGDELIAVADLWLEARWRAAPGAPGLQVTWNNAPLLI